MTTLEDAKRTALAAKSTARHFGAEHHATELLAEALAELAQALDTRLARIEHSITGLEQKLRRLS